MNERFTKKKEKIIIIRSLVLQRFHVSYFKFHKKEKGYVNIKIENNNGEIIIVIMKMKPYILDGQNKKKNT